MSSLVYFSSASDNTHRFVQKLGLPAQRIPLRPTDRPCASPSPYVLILPTYGGGNEGGAVPKQVIKFLNDEDNRVAHPRRHRRRQHQLRRGVLRRGDIIAAKCDVPYLYRFELMGTTEDVTAVRNGLGRFWQQQSQHTRSTSRRPGWITTPSTPC